MANEWIRHFCVDVPLASVSSRGYTPPPQPKYDFVPDEPSALSQGLKVAGTVGAVGAVGLLALWALGANSRNPDGNKQQ